MAMYDSTGNYISAGIQRSLDEYNRRKLGLNPNRMPPGVPTGAGLPPPQTTTDFRVPPAPGSTGGFTGQTIPPPGVPTGAGLPPPQTTTDFRVPPAPGSTGGFTGQTIPPPGVPTGAVAGSSQAATAVGLPPGVPTGAGYQNLIGQPPGAPGLGQPGWSRNDPYYGLGVGPRIQDFETLDPATGIRTGMRGPNVPGTPFPDIYKNPYIEAVLRNIGNIRGRMGF